MTDKAGHRGDPGRRGLAERRLDELYRDRSEREGPNGWAVVPGDDGEADGESGWTELDARDAGWDEPRPARVEGRFRYGAGPGVTVNERSGDAGRAGGPAAGDDGPGRGNVAGPQEAEKGDDAHPAGWSRRLAVLARPGRWRIDPERRGAVAVLAAILVAALAVGWQALASRPAAEPVADPTVSAAGSSGPAAPSGSIRASFVARGAAPATATSAAKVIVDVVGRVHRPGLVTLAAGARVADAVRAAGGALAGTNLTSINLARVCVDGEQIAVGVAGAAPGGTGAAGAVPGSGAPAALVDLNTATADQLDALPGVGPVMAQRIIAYRTDHGPFTAVSELQQVSGIGAAKYADLSPLVTL